MKFENKGKTGKQCPFKDMLCGEQCGLFAIGLKSCVFHAINLNLGNIDKKMMALVMNTDKLIGYKDENHI